MSKLPVATFPEIFKAILRRALAHWTPITVLLAFLCTGLSTLSLYSYTRAIGRVDLFLATLDTTSSLVAWLLVVIPIMLVYLCTLLVTTLFYGFSVSLFERCRRRINRAALWLLFPLVMGFGAFIILLFFYSDRIHAPMSIVLVAIATVVGVIVILPFKGFQILVALSTSRSNKADRFFFLFTLVGMILAAVMCAFFSITLIIRTYVGEDTDEAIWFVSIFSFITLVLSLAPTLIFFTAKGNTYRRFALGCAGAVVLFMVFLLFARGAMSSISFAAAGNLEVRKMFSERFVLDGGVNLEDLDNIQWRTRLLSASRVEIEAFQLFSLRDILLLCPSVLRSATLHQLPQYTRLCFLTLNSKVNRKPPLLRYSRQVKANLSWKYHAGRLGDIRSLSEHLNETKNRLLRAAAPEA